MRTLDCILQDLRGLHQADDRLQVRLRELLQKYFQFLKAAPRGALQGTRHLRLRADRDAAGRIRRISWTVRIKATKFVAGKKKWLTRRLPGRLRHPWVFHIAKDWSRLASYDAFEAERVLLTSLRFQVVKVLRALRLAFAYSWTKPFATDEDLARAAETVGHPESGLVSQDLPAVAGAAAYCRELKRLETELGLRVEEYRKCFAREARVSFEPAIRVNENGTLRIYWGHPQRVESAEGSRTFTDYMPRPTDRAMRRLGLPARLRKEVGAHLKRLRPLELRYGELLSFLARHRRRVGELLARISTHFATDAGPRDRRVIG